ncbi:MAG: hypothetical protein QM572_11035 [Nocardioides sp.]
MTADIEPHAKAARATVATTDAELPGLVLVVSLLALLMTLALLLS